ECKEYLPLIEGGIDEIKDEALLEILHQETVPLVLKAFYEKVNAAETFDAAAAKTALKKIRKENKLGGAQVFMPVRIAVTGEQHGPDIDKLIALMGKETYEARLKQTAAQLGIEL
ncbi:MAG: glutamate--tRNA ligase, partial [Bacillota bacterium]